MTVTATIDKCWEIRKQGGSVGCTCRCRLRASGPGRSYGYERTSFHKDQKETGAAQVLMTFFLLGRTALGVRADGGAGLGGWGGGQEGRKKRVCVGKDQIQLPSVSEKDAELSVSIILLGTSRCSISNLNE